jgi:tRNA(Ile)-lysidine synthase
MAGTRRLSELTRDLEALLDLPGGELVVALSGGADSAGLAYLVAGNERPVRAVHVDHGTPWAPPLRRAAAEIAEHLGLHLHISPISMPHRPFSEGRARAERYRALGEQRRQGEWVLTGHTREDQAETVLINLIRGSGPLGMAGIPRRSDGWVARPILDAGRGDVRELATLAGLPFADDPSNLDVELRRNAIRRQVLPELSRFNPSIVDTLARNASLLRDHLTLLDQELDAIPAQATSAHVQIPVGHLVAAARPIATEAIRRAVARLRPPYPPSAAEVERVWDVVTGETSAVEIESGIRAERRGPMLLLGLRSSPTGRPGPVPLPAGTHHLGTMGFDVVAHDERCRAAPIGVWSAVFPREAVLEASVDSSGRIVVTADGEVAWTPGERRHPVAFYEPGSTGYLSVSAREDTEWTSSL